MEFLINPNKYLITYRVVCGVNSWTSTETVLAKSVGAARGKFNMSRGGLFKIISVEEV